MTAPDSAEATAASVAATWLNNEQYGKHDLAAMIARAMHEYAAMKMEQMYDAYDEEIALDLLASEREAAEGKP